VLGDRINALVAKAVGALDEAGVPWAVCGGIGMVLAGRDRGTRDLDVITNLEGEGLARIKQAAREAGFAHHDRADRHSLEGLTLYRFWLPIGNTDMSMPLDVQDGHTPFHASALARAVPASIGGLPIRVVSREDLILLKLLAWRPVDRADAIELLRLYPERLESAYLNDWADRLGVSDRLREAQTAADESID